MLSDLSSRRTACDRCRSHKLQCIRERSHDPYNDCRRCLKAGTACMTTATARIGRQRSESSQGSGQTRPRTAHTVVQNLTDHSIEEPGHQVLTPVSRVAEDLTDPRADTPSYVQYLNATSTVPAAKHSPAEGVPENSRTKHHEHQQWLSNRPSDNAFGKLSDQVLPPPLDLREECVRKLANLHADLIIDLNTVRHCQTADKCNEIISMPEFAKNYNFPIGRMFDASSKFIELLHYFVPKGQPASQQDLIKCDFPSLLSMCTCYIYLIRIYRIILTSIHESITNRSDTQTKLPPIFPGLHLGGFSIEPHLDIQVKILVQTSEDMLAKIDAALGLKGDSQAGLLQRAGVSVEFLQSMLAKEISEEHIEGLLVGNRRSLSDIISSLKTV